MTNNASHKPLGQQVKKILENYFTQLDGQDVVDLHAMLIREVEKPLIEATLVHTKSNQSKAAKVLGLSRGTLRKKMTDYKLD